MLRPSYFYGKSEKILKYYQELEDYMMKDIASFLLESAQIGGKADREIFILQQMGMSNSDIVEKLAVLSKKSKKEVRGILKESVMTSFSNDKAVLSKYFSGDFGVLDKPAIKEVINAEWLKVNGELDNLTRSTMGQRNADIIRLMNEAELKASTGTTSYQTAICEALDEYAKKGMTVIYPTGTRRTIESAVRCCVVTSMNQTAAQVTNAYIAEGGIEYVLITAHTGARVSDKGGLYSHAEWQGKPYKIRGSEPGFPNLLESTGYDIDPITGVGTVVNPNGLHGYNCRHSHQPWDKDLQNPWIDKNGNPVVDPDDSAEIYLLQQAQRGMERNVRESKRELQMKEIEINHVTDDRLSERLRLEYDRIAYQLKQRERKLEQFVDEKNLTMDSTRTKVVGFGRKESTRASGRAKKYENYLSKIQKEKAKQAFIKMAKDGNIFINNWNKSLIERIRKIKEIDGYTDIFVHGDEYSVVYEINEKIEINVSASEFAEVLRVSPHYKGGNIRLISCKTGAGRGIVPSFLAKEFGVDVIAPTEDVNIFEDGTMILSNKKNVAKTTIETGKWLRFTPSGEVFEWNS